MTASMLIAAGAQCVALCCLETSRQPAVLLQGETASKCWTFAGQHSAAQLDYIWHLPRKCAM